MANCLEYAEQRTQSCAQYADQGYTVNDVVSMINVAIDVFLRECNVPPNTTLAHELGHACNLFHLTDPTNLMDTTSLGPAGRCSASGRRS